MTKKEKKAILAGICGGLLILLLAFFAVYRVTDVKVEGNQKYTDREIKNMVLRGPLGKNTILSRFIDTDKKIREDDFLLKVTIRKTGKNSLLIKVKERELYGYVEFLQDKFYFDRDGVIQVTGQDPVENVFPVDGIGTDVLVMGEKPDGLDGETLELLTGVEKIIKESEQKPDRIRINPGHTLTLYYGEIEVRFGNKEDISEKMSKLSGILPLLEGKKGTLYLQNAEGSYEGIVFESSEKQENPGNNE